MRLVLMFLASLVLAAPAFAGDTSTYGHPKGQTVDGVWTRNDGPFATVAALRAVPANARQDGQEASVADGSRWRFSATSVLAGDNILVATPSAGTGRWLRAVGRARLTLPVTYATADAAVLLTIPTGCNLRVWDLYWTVATNWTGGPDAGTTTIGISSNKSGWSTKGDLLGGAAGDSATALATTASPSSGTIGAKLDGDDARVIFKATDTIRFDRVNSAFDAGAGTVEIIVDILANPGA